MAFGDARGAALGAEPAGEGGAERPDPPAGAGARLQYLDVVVGLNQLLGRSEAGQPRADDEDALVDSAQATGLPRRVPEGEQVLRSKSDRRRCEKALSEEVASAL